MSFQTLNPIGSDDIDINLVLVHGLDGDSTAFQNQETKKSMIKCLRSSFPRSRIMKYVYPNNSIGMMTTKEPLPLNERGLNFIKGLDKELDDKAPIFFIGHSMGGLVIKQALITAKEIKKYQHIYDRTRSIAFYGTPHTGSYLANHLSKFSKQIKIPTTIAVEQLKDDNPYLLQLKQDFNQIMKQRKMKILSMIEAQKTSLINTKIVEYKSAICGLGDELEECYKMDHDHTQIQRPSSIKDLRYKHLYYFITKTVFKQNEIIQYNLNKDKNDDEEDEKEGFYDIKKILCFDPKDDKSDDMLIASRAYQENPDDVEAYTVLLDAIFANDAKSFRQQQIEKLFSNDIVKQNKKILNNLLQTKELINHVPQERIKESIELSMKYWDLLISSKTAIKKKQNKVETLKDVFDEFSNILQRRKKLEQGQVLKKDDTEFIAYVGEEIIEWFKEDTEIDKIKEKWREIYETLSKEEMFWRQIKTKITDAIKAQYQNIKDAQKEVDKWGISALITGIGGCVALAAFFISAPVWVGVVGVVGLGAMAVSGVMWYDKNKKKEELKNKEHELKNIEEKINGIVQGFQDMSSDSGEMHRLFSDLTNKLMKPKEKSQNIDKMNKSGHYKFGILGIHVKGIVKSLEELEGVCKDIIQTIDAAQKRFNKED